MLCIYIYIYTLQACRRLGGSSGDSEDAALKDTVKGPQFEETNTQILLNQKFLEEREGMPSMKRLFGDFKDLIYC